jgi:hypothetical protein
VAVRVTDDVDDVQAAAGPQHTERLGDSLCLGVLVEMVQHHRRQHPVETAVGVRQPLRIAAFEADSAQAAGLSAGPVEGTGIGIRSGELRAGM